MEIYQVRHSESMQQDQGGERSNFHGGMQNIHVRLLTSFLVTAEQPQCVVRQGVTQYRDCVIWGVMCGSGC